MMIYGFYLNRFRYSPLSVSHGCSAVIDDKRKTLRISGFDNDSIFSAQEIPLGSVRGVSLGPGPGTMILESASKSALGHGPHILMDFSPPADREFFYKVLKKWNGRENLKVDKTHDETLRCREDKMQEMPKEEPEDQSAVQQLPMESIQGALTNGHVTQPRTPTVPQGGYQLNDMLPFQISQVLTVLDGYDRKELLITQIRGQLADAQGQIARQQVLIAALVVALVNPDALPAYTSERELHSYLASSSIGFRSDEIAALNDVSEYRQAVSLGFRKVGARKSAGRR